jgi:methionyl-tRNA synthetase
MQAVARSEDRFYITTAIDYPNSAPHMGHAYEKVVADFYARCARLGGKDTWFLIGLDEHGQKIQEAAEREGKDPQAFVDEKAVVFRDLYRYLEISSDDFIRTSEPRHRRFAAELYACLKAQGDIYKGVYVGDYCISCEKPLSKSELVDGKCPIHERPTTKVEEETYFFRLGKYRDAIRRHIEEHPEFVVPQERRNEVLSRLRDEVLDLSVSRSTFRWGIPLADDPGHVLYVWIDALSNYLSALTAPVDRRAQYWPADCHVIGKDILWFHTVIWPAMLLSAGIPLPRQVYVLGFVLDKDGRKMAKQLGNVVDPLDVARDYSVDVLRYYLLRAFSAGQDGKFSLEELEERYERELANDLGNLVMRVTKLVESRAGGAVGPPGGPPRFDCGALAVKYLEHVGAREHHRALDELWAFIRSINAYINEREPWRIADPAEVSAVLYDCLEALRTAVHLLAPAMPRVASSIAADLGFEIVRLDRLHPGEHTYRVRRAAALFPRREAARSERPSGAGTGTPGAGQSAVDPVAQLDLRVGRVVEVRPHPDADKLYAMRVDLGEGEPRSICAGLREHLRAEELEGRRVVVLANLKPARMRGIESRGMILATDRSDGKVVPVDPGNAEPGEVVAAEGVTPAPSKKLSLSDFEKAPLVMQGGVVTSLGRPLRSRCGEVRCDAPDGARVR